MEKCPNQSALPDARLAADEYDLAPRLADPIEEPLQQTKLILPLQGHIPMLPLLTRPGLLRLPRSGRPSVLASLAA
jgi:hypothetical protein